MANSEIVEAPRVICMVGELAKKFDATKCKDQDSPELVYYVRGDAPDEERRNLRELAWWTREWFTLRENPNVGVLVETMAQIEKDIRRVIVNQSDYGWEEPTDGE